MKPKTLLIVSSLLGLIVLIAVGAFIFKTRFDRMMYPLAPPMPPAVSQSMDEILGQLEGQLREKAPQILTNLQPGLSQEKINDLEKSSGIKIPDEIKALYHWHDGIDRSAIKKSGSLIEGPMPYQVFSSLEDALYESRALSNQVAGATPIQRMAFNGLAGYTKNWIRIFGDGGDGYFYDLNRKPEQGAVFYHSMEEGDYLFFSSPKNLFAGMVKCYQQNAFIWKAETNGACLDEDFEAVDKIWREFGAALPSN
jgi:cell wall assembly regulator SMI1